MHDVVWLIRLPRLVLAAAVGMALSVSGVVMQAIVKIPWRIPISWASPPAPPWAPRWQCCWVWGSLWQQLCRYDVVPRRLWRLHGGHHPGHIGGRATSVKLLLSGSALSAICSAFSSFIIYLADSDHATTQVVRWTMGSLAAAEWPGNGVMCLMAVGGTLFFLTNSAPWI